MAVASDHLATLLARFPVTHRETRGPAFGDIGAAPAPLRTLLEAAGGATLADGFYRFHTPASAAAGTHAAGRLIRGLVPRYHAFAFDWSGREMCVDVRPTAARRGVVVVDPATGSYHTTGSCLPEWHSVVAGEPGPLDFPLYQRWRAAHPTVGPLAPDQVIGFGTPLFLGGADDLGNLELWDRAVYFALFTQLRLKTVDLPPGTPVDASILEQARRDM